MAFTKITPIDLGEYRNKFLAEGKSLAELFTAVAANTAGTAYGAYFEMKSRDDKYLVLVYNADATTVDPEHTAENLDVTIKAGNDGVFSSGVDLVLKDLEPGDFNMVKIDSGKFKNTANNTVLATLGDLTSVKDCVVITGESAAVKVLVIKMPF